MTKSVFKGKKMEIGLYENTKFEPYFTVEPEKIVVGENKNELVEDFYVSFIVPVKQENIKELTQLNNWLEDMSGKNSNVNYTAKTEVCWYNSKEGFLMPCSQEFYKMKFESFTIEYDPSENCDFCKINFKLLVADEYHNNAGKIYETVLHDMF